jgi:hypothetical protein
MKTMCYNNKNNAWSACRSALQVQARERSGPSGLHVAGQSPTSPLGWETMRQALIAGNVSLNAQLLDTVIGTKCGRKEPLNHPRMRRHCG